MSHSRYVLLILVIISLAASFVGAPTETALAQDGAVVVVNTGALHIRSGPAANRSVLGTVAGGTVLPVTGRNIDMTWWRVSSSFGVGWVADWYVIFRGDLDAVPVVSTPTGSFETPVAFADGLPATVYRNPNTDSFVVGLIPSGNSLPILARSTDGAWWQVSTPMGTGWVQVATVALRGDEDIIPRESDPGPTFSGPTVQVNADTPVTTQLGGGDTLTTLPAGTALPAHGRSADNGWWQVAGEFGVGWIPVAHVSIAGSSSNIPLASDSYTSGPGYTGARVMTAVVAADRKLAYGSDSLAGDVIWDAGLGQQLGVLARNPNGLWLEVTHPTNGWRGWINFSGLTLQGRLLDLPVKNTSPVVDDVVIANTGRLNVRSGPGVEYAALTSVPGGTQLAVTGRHPTLPWIRVTGDFGVGWVRIMYTIFRGNWSAVPAVTEPTGSLELPQAIVGAREVYAQADWGTPVGRLNPGLYTIVAWSPGYQWAQLDTPLGRVWLARAEFQIRGIPENAPVAG